MIDFLGIGGQRCGTTWLYRNLRRHPNISFPFGKELHYWDGEADPDGQRWLELFPGASGRRKQGEITPAYAILSDHLIREIARVAPDLRLLLGIRNPMERSWSAALYFLSYCQMEPSEASDDWFIDLVRSGQCREKSTFSTTIAAWRDAFSAEQLHVSTYDDVCQDPVSVLRAVAEHIGVSPGFFERTSDAAAASQGISTSRMLTPPPRVLDVLRELHTDEIDRLAPLLGRDLSHWHSWRNP